MALRIEGATKTCFLLKVDTGRIRDKFSVNN